ncbi:MAG: PIN domain-containing protein [Treponema sp.]|jgi:predicted nucleic acid-binding protein|nr:PIN domain-containing protein [Treponema sp.]
MMQYALDTNIVTYYLKGNKAIIDRVTRETDNKNVILIPPLVFYEIKRWLLSVNSVKKLALFETMCSLSGISSINKEILEIASAIYSDLQKKGITVGDNDILIAAYCIHYDLTLVTNNEKHFKYISNLRIVDWT